MLASLSGVQRRLRLFPHRQLRRDADRLRPYRLRRVPRRSPGFLKAPGGAPANVAIAVARLGGKAAFVGKLGDDEFGHMLAGS
ncbi:hypothetical protein GH714_010890 [Hevea brasiliensis]|uniref:Carbohydrate kinase PfkB domain-containing protein n=1 Tax=Hevea brasiliensis TaxID=3981 RepID=A0A6A6LFM1_HEVBR|nr:hypothetical protein GH714_010890 [Hevea brasiliensis]